MNGYDELMSRVRHLEELYGNLKEILAQHIQNNIRAISKLQTPPPQDDHIILHDITELLYKMNTHDWRASEYAAREIMRRWIK